MMIEKKMERERERERESAIDDTCYNYEPSCKGEQSCCYCKGEEGNAIDTANENSQPQYFSWYFF